MAELIPVEQINTSPVEQQSAGRYESVDAYFKDAYPNPLSHRFNERAINAMCHHRSESGS